MKILCNTSNKSYNSKPTKEQIRIIQNDLSYPIEIEVEDLANSLINGCNFRPAAVKGKSDNNFISQQVFGLDFDNPDENIIIPDEAIRIAKEKGLNPAFVYSTFSDTPNRPKFRMIFVLNQAVNDLNERNNVQNGFMKCFEKYIDPKCGNPARLFFGSQSKKFIYTDFEAVNAKEDVTKLVTDTTVPIKVSNKKKRNQNKTVYSVNNNVDAIIRHDSEYLRKVLRISNKQVMFQNRQEFFNYIYKQIDLAELLGVTEKNPFSCILPGHKDEHPSANVFREQFGTWKYKCFGCGQNLNIKQIIEILGGFKSEYQALKFIKDIYNIDIIQTEWSKEQESNIDSIIECIYGINGYTFAEACGIADKTTKNAQSAYLQILQIAKSAIFPDRASGDGNIIFYMSEKQLMKACKTNSKSQINRYLKLLAYHEMIIPLDDTEVPKAFLAKALKQRTDESHYHVAFYSIPSWVHKQTEIIKHQGENWKNNGYRMKAISYEMFFRAEGAEVAGKLYPQHKNIIVDGEVKQRQTSKTSDKLFAEVMTIVCDLVKEQGYCMESQVIEIMQSRGIRKENADFKLKQYLPEILKSNNLTKSRCNKQLKEKFSIETKKNSFPSIIYEI